MERTSDSTWTNVIPILFNYSVLWNMCCTQSKWLENYQKQNRIQHRLQIRSVHSWFENKEFSAKCAKVMVSSVSSWFWWCNLTVLFFHSLPYILGSSPSLAIAYTIENSGETAYLAQIRIVLPDSNVLFTKTPSNCKLDETAPNSNVMECDLNSGIPMFRGAKTSIVISVDTTKLSGSELVIKANVFSTGDEQNDVDNEDERIIPLQKFSKIEILG